MLIKYLGLLSCFIGQVYAQSFAPGSIITDRPSARQTPEQLLQQPMPQPFALPPAQHRVPRAPAKQGLTLYIDEFSFIGNTVFSDAQLNEIAQAYLHRQIDVSDLEQLRRQLTQHYIDHGYINSGALLPGQQFKDRRLVFQIIEGELSEIRISGNERLDSDYIRDRLMLAAGPPLHNLTFQEKYQWLLSDPLIERMHGRLLPGSQPGQSLLDLEVTRAKPYALALNVDNFRPPSTGAEQVYGEGWLRNATGFGDFFHASIGGGDSRLDIDLGWSIPVNAYDTRLGLYFVDRQSSVLESPLDQLDIENEFRSFEVHLSQPLWQSFQQSFNLTLQLAVRRSENFLLGRGFSFSEGELDGVSKVTSLRIAQEFIDRSVDHLLYLRSTMSVGLPFFGATWHDDERADGDYFAWLGQVQYTRKLLDNGAQFRVRGNVQLTGDDLLPLEQYAAGGVFSVRGYRENEVVREQGYALSLEFHYPLTMSSIRAVVPGQISVIPFVDYASAWGHPPTDEQQHLLGIGVGLNWSYQRLHTELYYAHDVFAAEPHNESDLQDDSFYFRVSLDVF